MVRETLETLEKSENNSVVSEIVEKLGNFINISWESGNNCMESCLGVPLTF